MQRSLSGQVISFLALLLSRLLLACCRKVQQHQAQHPAGDPDPPGPIPTGDSAPGPAAEAFAAVEEAIAEALQDEVKEATTQCKQRKATPPAPATPPG